LKYSKRLRLIRHGLVHKIVDLEEVEWEGARVEDDASIKPLHAKAGFDLPAHACV
jgi:hypothetical protein